MRPRTGANGTWLRQTSFCVAVILRSWLANFSGWAAPENLGSLVNTSFIDAGPAISKDGLSLYFNSNRSGGFGNPGTPGANDPHVSQQRS